MDNRGKFDKMDVKNSLDEFQELQTNNITENKFLSLHNLLSPHNNDVLHVKFTQPLAKEEKMTSKLKDNSARCNNLNQQKHKENMQISYPKFQLKRNEIAKHVSFVVVMCIVFVGILFDVLIEPSLMKDQRRRIWASLIRLFGFMAFVWAVIIMILDGVPFVRMQSLVLIFWAIWMYLKS
jgi:hypothetical protein